MLVAPVRESRNLCVPEYGNFISIGYAAGELGITAAELQILLDKAAVHIATHIGTGTFLEYNRDSFRFTGVAGIIALNEKHRIEIVPKFLTADSPTWREDFLWIAAMTQFGTLFHDQLQPVAPTTNANLFEIIAYGWLEQFETNQRNLIRNYCHAEWQECALDGDADEGDLVFPSPEGFTQSGLRLTPINPYNQLLAKAATTLRSHVGHPQSLLRLDRALAKLPLIRATAELRFHGNRESGRILSRHQRWLTLLELSRLIITTKGFGYDRRGEAILPTYIVRTHEAWEVLVRIACRRAYANRLVRKTRFRLGQRVRGNRVNQIRATPDVTIEAEPEVAGSRKLIDAKYRSVADDVAFIGRPSETIVASGDLYESIAFMRAASTNRIHLVYPASRSVSDSAVAGQPLEIAAVNEQQIIAVSLGVMGISGLGAFRRFCNNLRDVTSLGSS